MSVASKVPDSTSDQFPRLRGSHILVVENEYLAAYDAALALEAVGAQIIKPSASEAAARVAIEEQRPDAVVLDINFGEGPSFELASFLMDKRIPFVFFTGYGQTTVPSKFSHIERLEKPVDPADIVAAIGKLLMAS